MGRAVSGLKVYPFDEDTGKINTDRSLSLFIDGGSLQSIGGVVPVYFDPARLKDYRTADGKEILRRDIPRLNDDG